MEKITKEDFSMILDSIKKDKDKDHIKNAYSKEGDYYILKAYEDREEISSIIKLYCNDLIEERVSSNSSNGKLDLKDILQLKDILKQKDDKINQLAKEVSNYEELVIRRQAEFENYKKRTLKEKENFKLVANQSLLEELLPIVDSLEKAIELPKSQIKLDSLLDGVMLIEKQLKKVLINNGVVAIQSLNKEFDPNLHEAIQVAEYTKDNIYEVDTVINEWQKGYTIKDRIIRHAKVVIARANVGKQDKKLLVPSTIKEDIFSNLLSRLDKEYTNVIKNAYDKGEGQYIIKDDIISSDEKIKKIEEIFASVS